MNAFTPDYTLAHSVELSPFDLDTQARYPLHRLIGAMIHTAGLHADRFGFGIHAIGQRGLSWVLNKLTLTLCSPLTTHHPLLITTGISRVGHLGTDRGFLLEQKGLPVARATSKWAAIDLSTRRPTPLSDLLDPTLCSPLFAHGYPALQKARITLPHTPGYTHTVRYSDLDINRHVNSAVWIRLATDALPIELLTSHDITQTTLHFCSEGLLGEELHIQYLIQGNKASVQLLSPDAELRFHLLLTLTPRHQHTTP